MRSWWTWNRRYYASTKDGNKRAPRSQFKDVTYAGAFHQIAERCIPKGEAGPFKGDLVDGILEIVPGGPRMTMDGEAELKVYCEGLPLLGVEVNVVSQKKADYTKYQEPILIIT
jgi:hypothetical protein